MAALQNFRSALNGFNREDVVHYIEFINNAHASEVGQLRTELQCLQTELEVLREQPAKEAALTARLEESQSRCEVLEAELEELRAQLEAVSSRPQTEEELAAYRRAERNERVAGERVTQLYEKANGVLADATVRVDQSATEICELVDAVTAQLIQLQGAIISGKNTVRNVAASMYAIRPVSSDK